MDPEKNQDLSPEEQTAEQEALAEAKEDEVRTKVVGDLNIVLKGNIPGGAPPGGVGGSFGLKSAGVGLGKIPARLDSSIIWA